MIIFILNMDIAMYSIYSLNIIQLIENVNV